MNGDWPTDDEFDDDGEPLHPQEGSELPPHWGQCSFDSLEGMRQHLSDQLDDLLTSLDDGETTAIGVRFLVDATLDCRIEFFAGDGESVGAEDSLFILARDRNGMVDPTLIAALFDYLVEDLSGKLAVVDDSRIEAVFGGGERPLALLGSDGLPLDLEPATGRGGAW